MGNKPEWCSKPDFLECPFVNKDWAPYWCKVPRNWVKCPLPPGSTIISEPNKELECYECLKKTKKTSIEQIALHYSDGSTKIINTRTK